MVTVMPTHVRRASGNEKTVCATAVLTALGVPAERFRHTWNGRRNTWVDVLRRNGFAVRSRRSRLPRRCTVGQARAKLAALAPGERVTYAVVVPGHVLLLANDGRTLIDTDPRKRDRRPIRKVYAIFPK